MTAEAVREERATTRVSAPFRTRRLARGLGGERAQRVGGQRLGLLPGEVAEEDQAGGEVGRLERDGQAPLEAVAQAVGEVP